MSRLGKFILTRRTLSPEFGLRVFATSRECSTYKTMGEIRKNLVKLLWKSDVYTPYKKDRTELLKYLPKSQDDLPVRKMKDSYDSALIPLSTDAKLRETYITFHGQVRIGRLMEDVDLFAVWCCVRHLFDPKESDKPFPYIIATIRVDRIDILESEFKLDGDIRVSGHVSWVGVSSIEVIIRLDLSVNSGWTPITTALLLMAARNSLNTGPAPVNKIVPETPQELEIIQGGEGRKVIRQEKQKNSILRKVPSQEEHELIHSLFMKTIDSKDFFLRKRILPQNATWMSDVTISNLVFCHPEHRNSHDKIFGGFLIRQALELSWLNGFLYGSKAPSLVTISDIGFYKPVEVGSILKLESSITYTDGDFIQVFVSAETLSATLKEPTSTTSFNFTYQLPGERVTVYPLTYLEAMKYLEGRRNFRDNRANSKPILLVKKVSPELSKTK